MQKQTKQCRHGLFTFFADDEYVGRSLAAYGEYSEGEVFTFRKLLRPGDCAVDVGANIGALAIPMARIVGPEGRVFAIEAQPENAALLRENIKQNDLLNVAVVEVAAGDPISGPHAVNVPPLAGLGHKNYGRVEVAPLAHKEALAFVVPVVALDKIIPAGQAVRLIKIDVEGFEAEVLRGAIETIARCRPFLYVENDRAEKSSELIGLLLDLGYRIWKHHPLLYQPDNFASNPTIVWPNNIMSLNVFCADEAMTVEVDGSEEIIDNLNDEGSYDRVIARRERQLAKRAARKPGAEIDSDAMLEIAYLNVLMHRESKAEEIFAVIEAHKPGDAQAMYVSSILPFQRGDYETAWPLWELRYKTKNTETWGNRPHSGERWQGEYLKRDEPLLLWTEQGFGDAIMFARFIRQAIQRAPNVIVEVQPQLYELFELAEWMPPGRLHRTGRSLPRYDYHCSIPSLAYALGVGNSVGMAGRPYFRTDPLMVERWRKKVVGRIGICWEGSPRSERVETRNIPVDMLAPLTASRKFTSLVQRGQFESYADTAACMMALDLVITVDTSVAHLAGALGRPVWLLQPWDCDWRWVRGERTSRWYESMRIFPQPKFRDWKSVIAEVADALQEWEKGATAEAAE